LRWLTFLFPFVLLAGLVWIKAEHEALYGPLVLEDGPIENLQFGLFLFAGITAILAGRRLAAAGLKIHCVLYWLLGLGLVVVAMDEISWGQRVFSIATPERLAAVNLQSELTVHNLTPVMVYLHIAYLCVGAYGAFGWLVKLIWPPTERALRRFVIADWYLAGYFAVLLLVYGLIELAQRVQPMVFGQPLVIGNFIVFRDQEPAELMLALAMAIFTLVNFRRAGSLAVERAAAA